MKIKLVYFFALFSLLSCEINKDQIFNCKADLSLLSVTQFNIFTQHHLTDNNLSFIENKNFYIIVEFLDNNVFVNAPEPNWDMFAYNIEENYRYISFYADLQNLRMRLQIDKGAEKTLWFSTFNVEAKDWNPFEIFGSCAEIKAN